ncbi:hypothetical protein BL124_00012320 [Klebsiella pneumoniae]|uniref:Uncharacterized protein n=2 Tax=Enterobacteriaceae TaxID=543 RepID=A0A5Z6EI15_SALSE|nr:hypothetical protein BJF97_29960 [Klebsiella sp. LTGPAF-6F]ECS3352554.1 hypothetical protein [Salmonella enterica subsp. enterica serovar Senftenberg]KFC42451.1 hypothetical protein FF19_03630 [Klebsiella michiganensis]KKJ62568.1 hypothetical protein T644_13730 [Klebsiella pneumoniae MRSN 2404]KSX38206.1 hypothetical protein APT85_13535 [Klebsiella pneumoniae]OCV40655.1 hypothetical protein A9P88_28000 [Klebsiella quasipneumoniae subsp. similipneumoniae]PAQ19446.1 hypothetical protein B797
MNRQVVWLKSPEQRVGVVTTWGLARFAQKICQKHTQHVTEGKERELMVKSISINPEVAHMAIENVYCNWLMLNLIY